MLAMLNAIVAYQHLDWSANQQPSLKEPLRKRAISLFLKKFARNGLQSIVVWI
ncbi:hypothetical protein PH210_20760 [Paenibacillus sp. BSR1-1]|nr:hypothetical protein [Paenibacillus sp. BSR1-1]